MAISTADAKRRVVLPAARPGDVFDIQSQGEGRLLLGSLPRGHRRRSSAAANDLGLLEGYDPGAMILPDTNVLIYAFTDRSPFLEWARCTIAAAVSEDGAAVNAVSLAKICVGARLRRRSR